MQARAGVKEGSLLASPYEAWGAGPVGWGEDRVSKKRVNNTNG